MNLEVIYGNIGEGLQWGLTVPSPPPDLPTTATFASLFASQGDAFVRTDAQIKFLYYPLIIGQRKAFYRQRSPESSCVRKETVDINIVVTSRNGDRKIMQSIRIASRPPSRKRKRTS